MAGGQSVRDLARQLDVSIATVSRALNGRPGVSDETRRRILQQAEQLGYRGHVGAFSGPEIGLLFDGPTRSFSGGCFDSAMFSGLLDAAREHSMAIKMIDMAFARSNLAEGFGQIWRRQNVSGVIVRTLSTEFDWTASLQELGLPVVVVGARPNRPGIGYVHSESKAPSIQVVEHLVGLGHRRIGLAMHGLFDCDQQDRYEGFEAGHAAAGLRVDPGLVYRAKRLGSVSLGVEALDYYMSLSEPPTAVYVTDPLTTVGILQRCMSAGIRVPEDFSIVGFDDSESTVSLHPRPTVVVQDAFEIGARAGNWLARMLASDERNDAGREVLELELPSRLVLGETTGRRTDAVDH